jgi:SAM-dependent methyltransferase
MAKRKPASRERAPAAPARDPALGALELLDRRRAPYRELLAAIVADTLRELPPLAARPVIEIGAGAGQLRAWLPPAIAARTVHTDVSAEALRALRRRAPEADTRVAAADALPIDDASSAAVVGLCVFDAIGNEKAAVAEAARVLAPGGRFIHFLDMATLLETPFAKLASSALVPIPNVLADPGDHEWPLDILLLGRDWLAGLIDFARGAAHPLVQTFARYFEFHLSARVDFQAATRAFQAIATSGADRRALALHLISASRAAAARGYPPLAPIPFHSGKYLRSLIDTTFADSGAFDVERSEIVARASRRPGEPGVAYRSLCLGHQRILDTLPARLLAGPAEPPPAGQMLVEAAMFVFVARRR